MVTVSGMEPHAGSSKADVAVVVPCRFGPGILPKTVNAVNAMCQHSGVFWSCIEGEPRDVNRNRIVRAFLDSHKTHLMMVDADVIPPVDTLERLLSVGQEIVVAPVRMYVSKCLSINVSNDLPTATRGTTWPNALSWDLAAQPATIGCAGTGVILVHRRVFETVRQPWFVEDYGDLRGKFGQTEDIYFCRRVREAGFEIWCHPAALCDHWNNLPLSDIVPLGMVQKGN